MRRLGGLSAGLVLMLGDLVAVSASYALAYLIRASVLTLVLPAAFPFSQVYDKSYLLVVYVFVFAYEGLYTKRLASWEETRRSFRGMVIATAAIMMLPFVLRQLILSRLIVLIAFLVGVALVPLVRLVLRRLLVSAGLLSQSLVLVGRPEMAELLRRELARHRSLGYQVSAHFEPTGEEERDLARLRELLGANHYRAALLVFSDAFRPDELKQLFRLAEQSGQEVLVVPNSALLRTQAVETEPVGNLLVMRYRDNLLRPTNVFSKRIVELVLCTTIQVLLLPLTGLVALLVKVSSPGPVLFRQPRIGRNRELFNCLKFRTMRVDAESRLQELLARNPSVREEWEKYARMTNDPRVTTIGRFLRRFSLDELPQFWNVLRGEMSLIGPRPYLPRESGQIGDYLDTIVRVRPGMTGLWQVSGRSALPFRERLVLDEFYIRNWSLWMDFSILLRTFWVVLSGRGAV
ncbi:undecaprenyl-phosphate galactose phosphotransferase WbaP [candidate division WOR-3 bacterium]|nr:undecaprenyl-phosphate galactose phosphotransferase WbaP [candidate division WOR-3 bacterium]